MTNATNVLCATYATGGTLSRSLAGCRMAFGVDLWVSDELAIDCLDAPDVMPAGSCKASSGKAGISLSLREDI